MVLANFLSIYRIKYNITKYKTKVNDLQGLFDLDLLIYCPLGFIQGEHLEDIF
jgi:hypothetical protein